MWRHCYFVWKCVFKQYLTNEINNSACLLFLLLDLKLEPPYHHFYFDNMLSQCIGRFFQQTVGIAMRTNCAPTLAELFLL